MVAKSARFLAPLALVAVTLGVYLVIHSTLKSHTTSTTSSTTAIVNGRRQVHHGKHTPKYYTVRPGDTLSAISQRTGVGLQQLTTLNPSLQSSPNSLQTGQRLRLRR